MADSLSLSVISLSCVSCVFSGPQKEYLMVGCRRWEDAGGERGRR